MSVFKTLEKLGLSKKEAQVYQALLETGGATGYQISNTLDIKHSSAYFFLDELRKKGLATKMPHGKKQVYVPKDPRELIVETRKLAADVEEIVPKLLENAHLHDKPKILYFEGTRGYEFATEEITKRAREGNELNCFYAYEDSPSPDLNELTKEFFTTLKKNNVHVRAFTPDHPTTRSFIYPLFKNAGWELRFLPIEKYPSKSSYEVIGDCIILRSRHKGQSFLVENQDYADTLRSIFNLLWEETEVKNRSK